MTARPDRRRVSVAEVAALTTRLRALAAAGADVDDGERERFLADKRDLLARIAEQQEIPLGRDFE